MTDKEIAKIIDKIDFEEKWLINIKTENGFISIADIKIAISAIRYVVSKEKEKSNKECPYYDSEAETCGRSETEFDELNKLYYGMTDSMQKAVKDIMLVANGKEIEQ